MADKYAQVLVSAEGCIHSQGKVLPWAEECLRELRDRGIRVIILESLAAPDLSQWGLQKDLHFDDVLRHESKPQLLNALREAREHSKRTLVVGDSLLVMEAAHSAGADVAFVCSGKHSGEFGMSAAPTIDVPANGGHFVEPESMSDCCDSLFGGRDYPRFAISCFSFSAACLC